MCEVQADVAFVPRLNDREGCNEKTTRSYDPKDFGDDCFRIGDMFQHLIGEYDVKMSVRKIDHAISDRFDAVTHLRRQRCSPPVVVFSVCIGTPDVETAFETKRNYLPTSAAVIENASSSMRRLLDKIAIIKRWLWISHYAQGGIGSFQVTVLLR